MATSTVVVSLVPGYFSRKAGLFLSFCFFHLLCTLSSLIPKISKMGMSISGNTIDTTTTTPSYQHTILLPTFGFFPFLYSYRNTQINLQNKMWWWWRRRRSHTKMKKRWTRELKIDNWEMLFYFKSNQLNDIKLMWEKIGHGIRPATWRCNYLLHLVGSMLLLLPRTKKHSTDRDTTISMYPFRQVSCYIQCTYNCSHKINLFSPQIKIK